ncbi:MAG: VanZ family protein [Firmicutes bacterium]|nr:VanZ family protein [Bacillota bacterium]
MIRDMVLKIFEDIWPMMLIFSIIVISLRIVYLYKNKEKFILYKEVLNFGFILYVICLFRVVSFQDVSWSTSNFIPFKEMLRYDFGSELFFRNVIGNMIMFIPYGFFISYVLKNEKPIVAIILTFIVSLTIEVTQSLIGRVFDIDDIILNVLGGSVGFVLYYFANRLKFKGLLQKTIFYNIIIVLILVLIILYLSGVLYV